MVAEGTASPDSVEEGEDGGAVGEDMADFKDWLLVTFRGDYSRDIKSLLVEEFLREGSSKGALKTLDSYALPDPPAGRIIIVPVKRCRIKTGEWTSWRGEGLDARILPLAEAPGAQRVGLIVLDGVPCWGDSVSVRAELVSAALAQLIPESLHWDASWTHIQVRELRSGVAYLALFADTRETGRAIRRLFKPRDTERNSFSIGGVWAAGGRAIPIIFQPEEAREVQAKEWAESACLFALDTKFKSWRARPLVSRGQRWRLDSAPGSKLPG